MNAKQLRLEVIRPILQYLDLWSKNAENLVFGTACQESNCGEYIRQIGCKDEVGAFGIYQMELATHNDIWDNFLKYKPQLAEKIQALKIPGLTDAKNLEYNLAYSTAMCRIHYYRVPSAIPDGLYGQAQYWKKYYNTELGKGTIEQYQSNYKE